MDSSQWPQGIGVVKGVEEGQKKPRPEKEKAVNCPRCNSTNTKFCYYNNYSLSQPRYFCKTCRRYWTEGGSLRNVPVGGGSRKNRRSSISSLSSSSSSSSSSSKKLPDLSITPPPSFPQNPRIINHHHQGHDLNLAYPPPPPVNNNNFSGISDILNLNPNSTAAMEILKNGISSFMPDHHHHHANTAAMFLPPGVVVPNLHDAKPNSYFNFSLDGFCNGYGNLPQPGVNHNHHHHHHHHHQESDEGTARVFFPNLEDLKPVSSTMANDHHNLPHNHHQPFDQQNRGEGENDTNGYWNGMLGGGGGGGGGGGSSW